MFEERQGFLFVEDPFLPVTAAVRHGSEDDLGDFEAGLAESVPL